MEEWLATSDEEVGDDQEDDETECDGDDGFDDDDEVHDVPDDEANGAMTGYVPPEKGGNITNIECPECEDMSGHTYPI